MMFRFLYSLRYVSLIAVACSVLSSGLMFLMGAVKTAKAFGFYFGLYDPGGYQGLNKVKVTTKYLVDSIDLFLMGLVLFVFAFGIYRLFVHRIDVEELGMDLVKIKSIGHLKNTLAELIIVILFVQFLEQVLLAEPGQLDWPMLILPAAIILLAGALKLIDLPTE